MGVHHAARASARRPPCAADGSTSATPTACSIASTPPRARSCGTFRPTPRSTPAPTSYDDHVLFGSQDSYLYCLDADSGKLVWKYQSQDQIRCFPTVVDNLGFVAGCDGHLHVIDLRQGKAVGTVKIDSPTGCSPAVMDGTVFVGTEGHAFLAIDPRQAKILWRYEAAEHGAAFRSSAAVTPRR